MNITRSPVPDVASRMAKQLAGMTFVYLTLATLSASVLAQDRRQLIGEFKTTPFQISTNQDKITSLLTRPAVRKLLADIEGKGFTVDPIASFTIDLYGRELMGTVLKNHDGTFVGIGSDNEVNANFLVLSDGGGILLSQAYIDSETGASRRVVFMDPLNSRGIELNYKERKLYTVWSSTSTAPASIGGTVGCVIDSLKDLARPCEAALLETKLGLCVSGIRALPIGGPVAAILGVAACTAALTDLIKAVACSGIDCGLSSLFGGATIDWVVRPPDPIQAGQGVAVQWKVNRNLAATHADVHFGTVTDPRNGGLVSPQARQDVGFYTTSVTVPQACYSAGTRFYFVVHLVIDGHTYWSPIVSSSVAITGGKSIVGFSHSKGSFLLENGRWVEYYNGKSEYQFQETTRDSDWIYMRDDYRKMELRMPIRGGWSGWRVNGGPWNNLYDVQPIYG